MNFILHFSWIAAAAAAAATVSNHENLFRLIHWPTNVELQNTQIRLPVDNFHTRNQWNPRYCILRDAIIFPGAHFNMGSHAVDLVFEAIQFYTGIHSQRVYVRHQCELTIEFQRAEEASWAGVFFPRRNAIIIQTKYKFTPLSYYKVIAHEILHALGLEHITKTRNSVMSPALNNGFSKIFSAYDINALRHMRSIKRPLFHTRTTEIQ